MNEIKYYIMYGGLFFEEATKGTWVLKDTMVNTRTWYITYDEAYTKRKSLSIALGLCVGSDDTMLKIVKVTTEIVNYEEGELL